MLDSIFIGTSGLVGFSKALRVVSNNLANVNTTGFKGSQLNFGDYYYQSPGSSTNYDGRNLQGSVQLGSGVNALSTSILFRDGANVSTGNALDTRVTGNGFFVLKDSQGKLVYTRNGSFQSNNTNLVSGLNGFKVQGFDSSGRFGDIDVAGLLTSPAKATSTVTYTGNLPAELMVAVPTDTVVHNTTTVYDSTGGAHNLTLTITKTAVTGTSNTFSVVITDGTTAVGTTSLTFNSAPPGALTSGATFNASYTPPGGNAISFTMDFSRVTSTNSNQPNTVPASTRATLATGPADGYGTGQLSGLTIEQTTGALRASYTNGQTVTGPTVALARFDSEQDIREVGNGLFDTIDPRKTHFGRAGNNGFGSLTTGSLEGSNVDLAEAFSNLIVMQRGYQASSRVISTANELIQELFDTKGRN